MYTLKGIFPEPKKEQRRNFIKENMKQLKYMQGKAKEPTPGAKEPAPGAKGEAGKRGGDAGPGEARAGRARPIRKGDVAEFVRRKPGPGAGDADPAEQEPGVARAPGACSVGCQTSAPAPAPAVPAPPPPDARARLDDILDKKNKDPHLPPGVVGAESAEAGGEAPAGHVRLAEAERRGTLRTLRASFAELVRELNALPVRADTLRARDHKQRLEAQLARLEDGIKVFSRRAVYVKLHH